tara:strand:+ start:285 stop:689 length:405 start_codon:yes stop_codon:yes gene_type:complete
VTNKKVCFSINTLKQANELIQELKNHKKNPIIYINNYLVIRLGLDWLIIFRDSLIKKFGISAFKFYVNAGYDYGLCVLLIKNKFQFIKIKSNKSILKKIKQIADKNKVLLNPSFRVINLLNIKNIKRKISKFYK